MASKPLDTYIKTPPPSNPASRETYIEQQLGSIEKVLQKHTTTIEDNYDENVAAITEEQGVRATADSALAYSLQQLTATVDVNNTTTQGQITNLQTTIADATTATASQLQVLTATVDTNLGSTNAAIINEQKARATADSALSNKISALTSTVTYNNTQLSAVITTEQSTRATADAAEATARQTLATTVTNNYNTLNSAITTEATSRTTADTALAQSVTSTSAGSSRVYTQASAPSSTGRLSGDIWYDTSNNFNPYVWYSGAWQNNSAGAYSQYAGNNAAVLTFQQAYLDPTNGLGYKWGVYGTKGTASDGVTPAIILTGGNRINPSTGTYDTAVNKLVINANTEINGDLIVNGTITGSKLLSAVSGTGDLIDAGNILNNAVSDNQANILLAASGNTSGVFGIPLTLGDRVTILGFGAGSAESSDGGSGSLQVYYAGYTAVSGGTLISSGTVGNSVVAKAFCRSAAMSSTSYGGYITFVGFAAYYALPPASILQVFTCDASHGGVSGVTRYYNFSVQNTLGGDTGIAVIRLSR